jgi:hypothetical protein
MAGAEYDIFSEEALVALADYSKGIPREACKVGYQSLLLGASRQEKIITLNTVAEASLLAQGFPKSARPPIELEPEPDEGEI